MNVKKEFNIKLPLSVERSIVEVRSRLRSFGKEDFVNELLSKPTTHLLRVKGKLLRPTLILLGAYSLGEGPSKYIDMAVSVELLHTSSLIHDDLIDRDVERRGVETVHVKYGSEAAILAGDALISKAVELSSKYGSDVLSLVSVTAMKMCAGEMIDYDFQKRYKVPDLKEYSKIAELKSAAIMGTSSSIVALYKNSELAESLYLFGRNLGLAFQIRDDVIDFLEFHEKKGKSKNTDVHGCRPNIVKTLLEYSKLNEKEAIQKAAELNNYYIKKAATQLKNKKANEYFKKYADLVQIETK